MWQMIAEQSSCSIWTVSSEYTSDDIYIDELLIGGFLLAVGDSGFEVGGWQLPLIPFIWVCIWNIDDWLMKLYFEGHGDDLHLIC